MNTNKLAIIFLVTFLLTKSARANAGSDGGVLFPGATDSNLSYLGDQSLPRGMRNNNPGNLRISNNDWQGKISVSENTDGAFEQFNLYVYGVRAMIRLVRDSYISAGNNTISKVINRYAPSSENNTTAYINTVSSSMGISPNQTLSTDYNTMQALIQAMAKHENGRDAISNTIFSIAWQLS